MFVHGSKLDVTRVAELDELDKAARNTARVALPNLLVAALRIALEAKYLGVPIDKVWKDVVFWTLTEKPHSMLIITDYY